MDPVEVEQVETVERSAADVWWALSGLTGVAMPAFVQEVATPGAREKERPDMQYIRLSDKVSMRQRVVERDDARRLIRCEMTDGEGLAWSSCQTTIHVEATGTKQCKVTARISAVPLTESRLVESMLRDTLTLGLSQLKSRME